MSTASEWRAEKKRRMTLTALNLATNAAYSRCMKAGGHTPSSEKVLRDDSGILREIRVCGSCHVPVLTLKGWGSPAAAQRGGTR